MLTILIIDAFAFKCGSNRYSYLWLYPGTREELIYDWWHGITPVGSCHLDSAMPPKSVRKSSGHRGICQNLIEGPQDNPYSGFHEIADAIFGTNAYGMGLRFKSGEYYSDPDRPPHHDDPNCNPRLFVCPTQDYQDRVIDGSLRFDEHYEGSDRHWMYAHLKACSDCRMKLKNELLHQGCLNIPENEKEIRRWLHRTFRQYDLKTIFHFSSDICPACHAKVAPWLR